MEQTPCCDVSVRADLVHSLYGRLMVWTVISSEGQAEGKRWKEKESAAEREVAHHLG
jgi:hypothetical protein